MKKILVLVSEKLSANGICADAIINELKNSGNEVYCITNQEYGTPNRELVNNVQIERIKPRLTYRINAWCNNNSLDKISILVRKISFLMNKLKLIVSIPTWPLVSPLYSYRFYEAAVKLYSNTKYDCIISIYAQIDTLLAGCMIKRKIPEVIYIPYFLDSLSGGPWPKAFSKEWMIKRGLKWERRLLRNADRIIVMASSQKHHELYSSSEEYYSRMKVLDIPLLTQNYDKTSTKKILDESKVNIVYVGSMPCHIRNPRYILEIFKRLNVKDCRLTIIGMTTCPELIIKAQSESRNNEIILIDQISHKDAIKCLRDADVLLNIGNNIDSMVPSKIFEYMSIGKPIISTYPIKNEPSLNYLNLYPLSLLIEEDWDRINENVSKVEEFIISTSREKVCMEGLRNLMYKNTPEAFIDVINETLI